MELGLTFSLLSIDSLNFFIHPTDFHWREAHHFLRYLVTTPYLRLGLGLANTENLHGYSHLDWALTTEDRRSTSGWIFKYAGRPISWKSWKQPTVALLSTEGENTGMTDAAREALWLKGLINDLGIEDESIIIYYDHQAVGFLSMGERLHQRTKHIDFKHHFIRECITSGKINIKYIPTADMLADIFTKPLGKVKHQKAVSALGLV